MNNTSAPSARSGLLLHRWPFVLLCCAWLIPGLIGHDPWKADEPYSFGIVHHIITSGDWVVPTIAGEPFMEKPPLIYISAAFLAKLFFPVLPLHDGARLVCAVFMVITFFFTALIARELWGKGKGRYAVVILLGCVGLINHAHKLMTDVSLLSGFAVGLYGLTLGRRREMVGGFWTGVGVGIGFMSKGLLAPGILGIVALILPCWCREWRSRNYFTSLVAATVFVMPWLVVWPFALYQQSPKLFTEWFWVQNFGRFFGFAHEGIPNEPGFYLFHLPYFAWPALPLALWTVWHKWRIGEEHPFRNPPVVAFTVMFAVLSLASDARSLYALPMLIPLSLIAVPIVETSTTTVIAALDRTGAVLFALGALGFWIGWTIIMTGYPTTIADKLRHISPGYLPKFELIHFSTALVYTLLWIALLIYRDPTVGGILFRWGAGMTLIWSLMMTLWLPWTNSMRSYRSMVQDLTIKLPLAPYGRIGGYILGNPNGPCSSISEISKLYG